MARRDDIEAFFETPSQDQAPPSAIPPPVSVSR
jgi:hypothetical protein